MNDAKGPAKPSVVSAFDATTLVRIVLAVTIGASGVALLISPKPFSVDVAALSKSQIEEYVAVGLWYAGAVALLPLMVLLLTARWWTKPLPAGVPSQTRDPLPKGFWLLVVGAMILFAGLAAPRLSQSLWDDEEYAVRKTILGGYRENNKGQIIPKKLSWISTLWYYQSPNNHCFQSILSRLSLSSYRALFRPAGLQVSEVAVRLPSYIAGILAIGALAVFVARMGFPWAGALAAWLLAIHPWFLRIAPEARGYAFVFLLLPCIFLIAKRVTERGTWATIVSLTVAEFLILYTWPGVLLTLLMLNSVMVILVWKNFPRSAAITVLSRWAVAGVLAGTVFCVMVAPWIPQLLRYVKNPLHLDFTVTWLNNLGALMLTGSHWSESGLANTPYMELSPQVTANPWPFGLLAATAVILIVIGSIRFFRAGTFTAFLLPVILLPGPMIYGLAKLKNGYIFDWYLSFMLPGLVALAALGCTTLCAKLCRPALPRWLAPAAACLIVALYFVSTQFARVWYITKGVEPFRESVLRTRPTLDPNAPANKKIITATSGSLTPVVYDPLVRAGKTVADYHSWMREADSSGAEFFVNLGHPFGVTDEYPQIRALLADERYFDQVAILQGAKPLFDRTIYKYRPGSLPP